MNTSLDQFDADRRHNRYEDRRQLPEFSSTERSQRGFLAEPRFHRASADFISRRIQPAPLANSQHQADYLPEKYSSRRHFNTALHGSRPVAAVTKQQAGLSDNQRRGKWPGMCQCTVAGDEQRKVTSTQPINKTLSHAKKSGLASASRKDRVVAKTSSVPTVAEQTVQTSEADSQMPAKTSASAESEAPIRPEDIIIIRRYNLDGSSTAEKKPDETEPGPKRHVIRLVRDNVKSPVANVHSAATNMKKDRVESGTTARQQNVMKKRRWSGGIMKTAHPSKTDEDNVVTSRVEDDPQMLDHSKQYVITVVDLISLYIIFCCFWSHVLD